MLHCRGGYFYVGHTDDFERRIGEHKSGLIPGFTADHQPVELVWSDQFENREDAKAAERKLKGWSRAKKLALIRGDWERISTLAKKKDSPSTSSGRTGKGGDRTLHSDITSFPKPVRPELVEGLSFALLPHSDAPPTAIDSVKAKISVSDGLIWLNYTVKTCAEVRIPASSDPDRTDGLWQTTCFEMFVKDRAGPGYCEFNFSPSTRWAAYRFDEYREGMRDRAMRSSPAISWVRSGDVMLLNTSMDADILDSAGAIGFSAVIEEESGTKSYWALAHPPGAPDFHHPSCFTTTLPPPSGT